MRRCVDVIGSIASIVQPPSHSVRMRVRAAVGDDATSIVLTA